MAEKRLLKDADKTALTGGGVTALHSHPGGGGSGLVDKSGTITTSGGSGSVTFNTPYADTNYAIMLTAEKGVDAVIENWLIKTVNGFDVTTETDRGGVIDTEVLWMTAPYSNP